MNERFLIYVYFVLLLVRDKKMAPIFLTFIIYDHVFDSKSKFFGYLFGNGQF